MMNAIKKHEIDLAFELEVKQLFSNTFMGSIVAAAYVSAVFSFSGLQFQPGLTEEIVADRPLH